MFLTIPGFVVMSFSSNISNHSILTQVLSSSVHILPANVPALNGGPVGQLRGRPHEFPRLRGNQTPANQSHTEETIQGDHDAAGANVCVCHCK